jgi:hypothetical protein
VEDSPKPVLWAGSARPISGPFERISLAFEEAKWLSHLHPIGGNRFIVEAGRKLFLVDENGEALQVSRDGEVFWSQQVALDQVVFSECWIRDLALSRCAIASVSSDARTNDVWQSDHFWPIEFALMSEKKYLVQLANEEEQALVMLESQGDGWTSTIIWRDEAPSETEDKPRPR